MPKILRPERPLTAKEFAKILKSKENDDLKLRAYAIYLLSQGLNVREVAEIVEKSEKTVRTWVKSWDEGGLEGLKVKKRVGEDLS